jgi:hypothetical protein
MSDEFEGFDERQDHYRPRQDQGRQPKESRKDPKGVVAAHIAAREGRQVVDREHVEVIDWNQREAWLQAQQQAVRGEAWKPSTAAELKAHYDHYGLGMVPKTPSPIKREQNSEGEENYEGENQEREQDRRGNARGGGRGAGGRSDGADGVPGGEGRLAAGDSGGDREVVGEGVVEGRGVGEGADAGSHRQDGARKRRQRIPD